jgi:hypothetical protein
MPPPRASRSAWTAATAASFTGWTTCSSSATASSTPNWESPMWRASSPSCRSPNEQAEQVPYADFVFHTLEDPMTIYTQTGTRPVSAPAYYLGRPAGLWLTAMAPRSTTRRSPRTSCAGDSAPRVPGHH